MKRHILIQRSNRVGPQGGKHKGWIALDSNSWEKVGGTNGSRAALQSLMVCANVKDQFTFHLVPGIWNGKPEATIKAHEANVKASA